MDSCIWFFFFLHSSVDLETMIKTACFKGDWKQSCKAQKDESVLILKYLYLKLEIYIRGMMNDCNQVIFYIFEHSHSSWVWGKKY